MRTSGKRHLARSFVTIAGAVLVVAGAGLAAARTMSGPPWQQPVLSAAAPCEQTDGTVVSDGTAVTDVSTTADCTTTTETTDPAQQAADTQTYFEQIPDECGTTILGDANLTDATTDPNTVEAFGSLADALDSGQVDHMVQSVRVLLENCQAHANDGLRNALYHHGLNWVRHYEHELWLEQKFADTWPDGKPGGGHDADAETTHGKPDKTETTHGNPHASDPSWAPGNSAGGQGKGLGHSE
jgi:hypothetical protein